MKLETTRLGEVQVEETGIYTFEQGIPGFEELRRFALIDIEPESPFRLLQSIEDQEISFIVVNPFLFFKEYEWELPASVEQELQLAGSENVEIQSIVTIQSESGQASLNLAAPLILNIKACLGKQHILHDYGYSSSQPLLQLHTSNPSVE